MDIGEKIKHIVSVESLIDSFFSDEDDFYSYKEVIHKKLKAGKSFSAKDVFQWAGYISSKELSLPFLYDEDKEFEVRDCQLEDIEIRRQGFVEVSLHDLCRIAEKGWDDIAIFGAVYVRDTYSEAQINLDESLQIKLESLVTLGDKLRFLEKALQYWEFFLIEEEDISKLKTLYEKDKDRKTD